MRNEIQKGDNKVRKRILSIALVLTLVMALVIPTAVFAASHTGTSLGSGSVPSIPSTIAVTAPGAFTFGTFSVGANPTTVLPTAGSVTVTPGNEVTPGPGYTLTAKDQNTGLDSGKMLMAGSIPLANLLEIWDGAAWLPAGAGITYAGGLAGVLDFDARQTIIATDTAGVYAITIEFVGTIAF